MEVPPIIKQEKIDYEAQIKYEVIEPDVNFKTNILDSMDIKEKSIKIECHSYVSEPNDLIKHCNLMEEAKMIENNDKCMFNCSFNKIYEHKGPEIKLEGSGDIDGFEQIDVNVDVKWEIEDDELNIKEEKDIKDEEHGKMLIGWKRRVASGSKTNFKKHNSKHKNDGDVDINKFKQCDYKTVRERYLKSFFNEIVMQKCDQCDYQTKRKGDLKSHNLKHKKSDKIVLYKCDQCDYQTRHRSNLKHHSLKHKKSHEIVMYKCDHCYYQTMFKGYLKKHSFIHKKFDEDDMYRCDQCKFQTVHKRNLKKHGLLHKKVNIVDMLKCDQCDYQTVRKDDLKKHILRHILTKLSSVNVTNVITE